MKRIILWVCFTVLFKYNFSQQKVLLRNEADYNFVNLIIHENSAEGHFDVLYVLDKVLQEFELLKKMNKSAFEALNIDSSELAKYIAYTSDSELYFNPVQLRRCKLIDFKLFDSLQATKKLITHDHKKREKLTSHVKFPLYGFSKPYFFDEYCFISVAHFTGFYSGDYSVLLYKKENDSWKFERRVLNVLM